MSGLPVVDGVFLNGNGPYRFILDTGEQGIQVDASLARKLGLVAEFRVDLDSVTGTIRVPGGHVAEISLGSATASNPEVLFTALDAAHAISTTIKGVLGQQFLAHFDYLLDFADHKLLFGGLDLEGNRVPFDATDGGPAIETSEGKLVIDSGTNVTILYRPSFAQGLRHAIVQTSSGQSFVPQTQALRLRIAGHDYRVGAICTPSSLAGGGILQATLFRAIYFSNSAKYVILDPVARRHDK